MREDLTEDLSAVFADNPPFENAGYLTAARQSLCPRGALAESPEKKKFARISGVIKHITPQFLAGSSKNPVGGNSSRGALIHKHGVSCGIWGKSREDAVIYSTNNFCTAVFSSSCRRIKYKPGASPFKGICTARPGFLIS